MRRGVADEGGGGICIAAEGTISASACELGRVLWFDMCSWDSAGPAALVLTPCSTLTPCVLMPLTPFSMHSLCSQPSQPSALGCVYTGLPWQDSPFRAHVPGACGRFFLRPLICCAPPCVVVLRGCTTIFLV